MSGAFGQQIKEQDMIDRFISAPGQFIVKKTLQQMARVKQFQEVFGKYVEGSQQQRWADYQKFDWSIRQLPAINIFEEQSEDKTSSNAWLNGSVQIQVFWPGSFRRSDLTRIPVAFKGALHNFFESVLVTDMLDELYSVERDAKVPGLNEYGKVMIWSPNVEGIVESELVPVTIVNVKYRVDLRSWYRFLEFDNRTKENPFERTLEDLVTIGNEYDGVQGTEPEPIDEKVKSDIPFDT